MKRACLRGYKPAISSRSPRQACSDTFSRLTVARAGSFHTPSPATKSAESLHPICHLRASRRDRRSQVGRGSPALEPLIPRRLSLWMGYARHRRAPGKCAENGSAIPPANPQEAREEYIAGLHPAVHGRARAERKTPRVLQGVLYLLYTQQTR